MNAPQRVIVGCLLLAVVALSASAQVDRIDLSYPTWLVSGGTPRSATLRLFSPAPPEGLTVSLSVTPGDAVTVPESVSVPAGSMSATFEIVPKTVESTTSVTLKATAGESTKQLLFDVRKQQFSSLSFQPASISAGGSPATATLTLTEVAPLGGLVVPLAVIASDAGDISIPSSVTLQEGQKSATFEVKPEKAVTASETATVEATVFGNVRSASLTLVPDPVDSVTVDKSSVVGGNPVTATAALAFPAPPGGVAVSFGWSGAGGGGTASATVPEGQKTVSAVLTTKVRSSDLSTSVSATTGGGPRYANVTITAQGIETLTLDRTAVTNGEVVNGTFTIKSPAPPGGLKFHVTVPITTRGKLSQPEDVVLAEGSTTGSFSATASEITEQWESSQAVTVSLNDSTLFRKTGLRMDVGGTVSSVTASSTDILSGEDVTLTISLASTAPAAGVALTPSWDAALASDLTHSSQSFKLVVPAGSSSTTMLLRAKGVASTSTLSPSFKGDGDARSVSIQIRPAELQELTFSKSEVIGGDGTVNLVLTSNVHGAVPSGAQLALTSSDSSALPVPQSIAISPDAEGKSFRSLTTSRVSEERAVTVSGTYAGVTRNATVTIKPLLLTQAKLNTSTASFEGPKTVQASIDLNGYPSSSETVTLQSSNPAAASVPGTLSVPSTTNHKSFDVTLSEVGAVTPVTVTATLGNVSKSFSLEVKPKAVPQLSLLSLSPASVTGGAVVTGTATLSSAATESGTVVTLSSSDSAVAPVPATLTIRAGATSGTFTLQTNAPANALSPTITASAGGVAKAAQLTVSPAPSLGSVTVSPNNVAPGSPVTVSVALTAAAGSSMEVLLSSSDAAVFPLPGSVTIAAGSMRASTTVRVASQASVRSVTIRATMGAVTKQATLAIGATAR